MQIAHSPQQLLHEGDDQLPVDGRGSSHKSSKAQRIMLHHYIDAIVSLEETIETAQIGMLAFC
jgi:hypothetical protein